MMNDDHDIYDEEPKASTALANQPQHAVSKTMANSQMAHAMAEQRIAQVQARWALARRFPRSISEFRAAMVKECQRPAFAKVALYAVPRGKKTITGPSIRFAEAALRHFKNVSIDEQILAEDEASRLCVCEGTDMEGNASFSMNFIVPKTVERKFLKDGQRAISQRVNTYGDKVFLIPATDEETAMLHANMRSKAYRTILMRLLPGEVVDECKTLILQTQRDEDARDPDAAKNELFDAFAQLGVTPSMLVEFLLGQPIESVTPAQLAELRAVYQSLKSGDANWPQWMASVAPQTEEAKKDPKGQALRDKLKAATAKKPRLPADGADQGEANRRSDQ